MRAGCCLMGVARGVTQQHVVGVAGGGAGSCWGMTRGGAKQTMMGVVGGGAEQPKVAGWAGPNSCGRGQMRGRASYDGRGLGGAGQGRASRVGPLPAELAAYPRKVWGPAGLSPVPPEASQGPGLAAPVLRPAGGGGTGAGTFPHSSISRRPTTPPPRPAQLSPVTP